MQTEQLGKFAASCAADLFRCHSELVEESLSSMLGEGRQKTPDLEAYRNDSAALLDVKTINVSLGQLEYLSIPRISAHVIKAAMVDDGSVWGVHALREDERPSIGDTMPTSYVWKDNVKTDVSLGGTAAYQLYPRWSLAKIKKTLEEAGKLYGPSTVPQLVLLRGPGIGKTELLVEPGAIVINNAVVVKIGHYSPLHEARDVISGLPDKLRAKIESTMESAKQQLLDYRKDLEVRRIIFFVIRLDVDLALAGSNYNVVRDFLRQLERSDSRIEIVHRFV